MRKLFAALAAVVLVASTLFAGPIGPPSGFEGSVWAGTFVLTATYGEPPNAKAYDVCTIAPYEELPVPSGYAGHLYNLVAAGHCVQEVRAGAKWSVSENINTPAMPVTLVKAREDKDVDYALFQLKTDKQYPVAFVGNENRAHVGDPIVAVHFAGALGKQLSYGYISSDMLMPSYNCSQQACRGFLVQMYGTGGASGGLVYSAKRHEAIGIVVFGFGDVGNVGMVVEPISLFKKFLSLPPQEHPTPAPAGLPPGSKIVVLPDGTHVLELPDGTQIIMDDGQ